MISKASVNYIRISPRKVRYVIDLIRKKNVSQAQAILSGAPRRAGVIVQKLLNQALDAAEKNSQIKAHDLFISKIMADGGPTMKRFRAASMGRASVIRKRTSHIYLELDTNNKNVSTAPKPAKAAAKAASSGASAVKPKGKMALNKKTAGAR